MSWTSSIPPPPDLLRRFVATPLSADLVIGTRYVSVETNDLQLLNCLEELAIGTGGSEDGRIWCRLIRDEESKSLPGAMQIVRSREVVLVTCGGAIVVAADRGTRELLGFVGGGVSPDAVRALVVPIIEELLSGFPDEDAAHAPEAWQ